MTKNASITFRVTEEEKELIKTAAAKQGLTMSGLIQELLTNIIEEETNNE